MNLSKRPLFRTALAAIAVAIVACATQLSFAHPVVVEFDGKDQANLASEGNWWTTHANVNFAFTYGQIETENLNSQLPGMAAQCAACSTSYHFRSTATPNGGAIGFGTNNLDFPAATSYAELSLTVNPNNALPWLYVILKDADAPFAATEDLQYRVDLPAAPGTYTLTRTLHDPTHVNAPQDSIPNFDVGFGMREVQIQYPFGAFAAPNPHMDLTIHSLKIRTIPEPTAIALVGLAAIAAFGLFGRRRS